MAQHHVSFSDRQHCVQRLATAPGTGLPPIQTDNGFGKAPANASHDLGAAEVMILGIGHALLQYLQFSGVEFLRPKLLQLGAGLIAIEFLFLLQPLQFVPDVCFAGAEAGELRIPILLSQDGGDIAFELSKRSGAAMASRKY